MRPHRWLVAAVASVLLVGVPAVGSASEAPRAAARQDDPSKAAERDLRRHSTGKVTVARDQRGVVEFVGTEPGKPVRKHPQVAAQPSRERQAAQYLRRYGPLWALDHAGSDAHPTRTATSRGAGSIVRFQQTVGGLPVLGGELAVALDGAGNLRSVSGETTPLPLSAGETTVTPAQARTTAVALVARAHHVPAERLRASEPEPYAYDPALLGPATGVAELAPVFKVEVTGPAHINHLVLVDRTRGSVPLNFNQVSHAERVVCDRNNTRDGTDANDNPRLATCAGSAVVRHEGSLPTGNADVDAAYAYTGDTADYFENEVGTPDLTRMIGTDTGSGKKLRSTVRYCLPADFDPYCPMRNAFWNGNGVYYGDDMALADDVVAHELTHGVIQKTANLAYWYQSGAINESMADVFGELMDLNNPDTESEPAWQLGEGSPFGVIRDMANPGLSDPPQPDRMTSARYAAEPISSDYFDNGGVHLNSGVGNKAAYLIAREPTDGVASFNGYDVTGIGHAKAADVYYETLRLLASGADYQDLFHTLPQACKNLVGAGGITAGNCVTVSRAVAATEMNQQPPKPGAQAPEAPVCPSGTTKAGMFLDRFGSLANWRTTRGMWHLRRDYAKSATTSMYGWEPIRRWGEPKRTYATLQRRFEIPRGVDTFLRFDHQYLFAHAPAGGGHPAEFMAGGTVQYSTNGGRTFQPAARLPWVNGPSRTIKTWNPNTNRYESPYQGFGGDSHGFMSSRVNLTSLAGKDVIFRWRITADPEYSFDGWTVDDVNVYACGGARPSSPSATTAIGGVGRAEVRWRPPVWPGDGGVTRYTLDVRHAGDVVRHIGDIPAASRRFVVGGLRRASTYVFVLRAYSPAGAGGFADHRLVGLIASARLDRGTIASGETARLRGRLVTADGAAAVPRRRVVFQGRPRGATGWRDIASKTTALNGGYVFSHRPGRSFQYRVVYRSGEDSRMGTWSDVRSVWVR